jgi:Ca2+-binding EF-hand superfamily protein
MIRIFSRRGLLVEAMIREKDTDGRGLISRSAFLEVAKHLGLPYSKKELIEIVDRYLVVPSSDVDYEALLREAGILSIHQGSEDISQSIDMCGNVLVEVKRMIVELVNIYGRSFDDIFSMFSCWDHEGTGSVTCTQFLRVLGRLHIELTDSDQDFLVELLDVDSMGRIDFGRLLTYCISDTNALMPAFVDEKASVSDLNSASNLGLPSDSYRVSTATRRPRTASKADEKESSGGVTFSALSSSKLRPTTASGRVSASEHGYSKARLPQSNGRSASPEQYDEDSRQLIIEFPDDIIDDDLQQLTPNTFAEPYEKHHLYDVAAHLPSTLNRKTPDPNFESQDICSLNDTTLVTDQDDSNFGSPFRSKMAFSSDRLPRLSSGAVPENEHGQSQLHRQPVFFQQQQAAQKIQSNLPNSYQLPPADVLDAQQSNWFKSSGEEQYSGPRNRSRDNSLDRMAKFTLNLRDRLYLQHSNGSSLRDLFHMFAYDGRKCFTAVDLVRALAHIDGVSDEIAEYAVRSIAIDGVDAVSLGEFKVFVVDHDHKELEMSVHNQMAQQLERLGRQFEAIVNTIFNTETEDVSTGRRLHQTQWQGFMISVTAFRAGLLRLGLKLTSSDMQRWCTRFDINDDGNCSAGRFLHSVQASYQWQNALRVLELQEEAVAEANTIRERQRSGENIDISDELLSMAEFLGIRPITEQHLLWIAVDALRAPLPINWSAQKDNTGRIYFYNHISNQSRWDHPLDSHFRMLRDEYRYR